MVTQRSSACYRHWPFRSRKRIKHQRIHNLITVVNFAYHRLLCYVAGMARYREIADDLRSKIKSGDYPVGTKLPSISDLQDEYDVPGLNTIRAAQQILVDEGMLETRRGVGAFVVADSPREFDVTAALTQARDTLTTVLTVLQAEARHTVTFDLADEKNKYPEA